MLSIKLFANILLILFTILSQAKAQRVTDVLVNNQRKIFQNFKSKYGKKYRDSSEQLYRNLIVFKNADKISNHNLNLKKPYTLAMNLFSDLTQSQFKLKYTTLLVSDDKIKNHAKKMARKADLLDGLCSCDVRKFNEIVEIERLQNITKSSLIQKGKNLKNKIMNGLTQIQSNITNFISKIPFLSNDQYNITVTKLKLDANKVLMNKTTGGVNSTQVNTSAQNANGNLKKNDLTQNLNTLPFSTGSITGSSPQLLQDKISTILSKDTYLNQLFSNIKIPQLNKTTTNISTNSITSPILSSTGTTQNLTQTLQQMYTNQVLGSLGDSQLTSSLYTQEFYTALLQGLIVPSDQNVVPLQQIPKPVLLNANKTTTATSVTTKSTIINSITTLNNTGSDLAYIDWSNYTGPVRFQGNCGACYALASIANVQSLLAIYAFGFAVQLSAQQIIDCSNNSMTFGCDGGYLQGSYQFLQSNGATTQYVYPYRSAASGLAGNCRTTSGPFKILSFRNLPQNDCDALKNQLKKKPVSLGIASYMMQFYQSGVFTDCDTQVDHAVLLVGYNVTKGWKIKNSWGASWGQSGFGWIQDGNSCGICSIPTVPTISSEPR